MAFTDWELAARFSASPQYWLVKDKRTEWPYASFYEIDPVTGLPVYGGGVIRMEPHFPYGWTVEPD